MIKNIVTYFLLILGIFFITRNIQASEYFDNTKWPITHRNIENIKAQTITYYDRDNNKIQNTIVEFNKEGFPTRIIETDLENPKNNKKVRLYYNENMIKIVEIYNHENKLQSKSSYDFISNLKIIRNAEPIQETNITKFHEIYEYNDKGNIIKEIIPSDESEIDYKYDKKNNLNKIVFHGPDGTSENDLSDYEYDNNNRVTKDKYNSYTYYENGKRKEIIPLKNPNNYRLIKYTFTYY